jgi:hypothetical protein
MRSLPKRYSQAKRLEGQTEDPSFRDQAIAALRKPVLLQLITTPKEARRQRAGLCCYVALPRVHAGMAKGVRW